MTGPGDVPADGLPVLAALVGRQAADLELHAAFLLETLAATLPPDRLVVERRHPRWRRAHADDPVLAVRVRLGELTYGLTRPDVGAGRAMTTATVAHTASGVVLRTEVVGLDAWSARLAADLQALARHHDDVAAALQRATRLDP